MKIAAVAGKDGVMLVSAEVNGSCLVVTTTVFLTNTFGTLEA